MTAWTFTLPPSSVKVTRPSTLLSLVGIRIATALVTAGAFFSSACWAKAGEARPIRPQNATAAAVR